MAKGLLAGMTDYSHQSFEDIITDLKSEIKNIDFFVGRIEGTINKLKASSYWDKNVPFNFKSMVAYSLKHYKTAKGEFEDILIDLRIEVKEHHCVRLKKISRVAQEINVDIGKMWHQEYDLKDYGNSDFSMVEDVYGDTRDMAVNLLDVENLSVRLRDFIGKSNLSLTMKNNPWISGSFYLFLAIVIFAGLGVLSSNVHWSLLPIIIIGGLLIIGIIGAFQLRNDDKLKEESFMELIKETYKRLPLLKQVLKK